MPNQLVSTSQTDQTDQTDQTYQDIDLVSMVKSAAKLLPINSYGLPEGIYRPDLLPNIFKPLELNEPPEFLAEPLKDTEGISSLEEIEVNLADEPPEASALQGALSKASLTSAFSPLCYSEGFPAQEGGRPFWTQLEFEPLEAYQAFEEYLVQGLTGVRQLFLLPNILNGPNGPNNSEAPKSAESAESTEATKSPDLAAFQTVQAVQSSQNVQTVQPTTHQEVRLGELQEFFWLYYWEWRAKAYDMFNIVARKQQRISRALQMEDDHFLVAERLNAIALTYIDDNPNGEFMQLMTPKVALEMLKNGTALQRISVGLPASGPSPNQKSEGFQGTSIEVQLRTIAQQNGVSEISSQDNTSTLREVLRSPETAALAQELIIKLNSNQETLNP